jgi:hypothetical protein
MTTTQIPLGGYSRSLDVSASRARTRTIRGALTADQRLARAFLWGTLFGTIVVFAFCGGIALASGMGVPAAIGIGVFTALWGGPGFGGMMGATVYFSNHTEDF